MTIYFYKRSLPMSILNARACSQKLAMARASSTPGTFATPGATARARAIAPAFVVVVFHS